jgi:hypothetical protein
MALSFGVTILPDPPTGGAIVARTITTTMGCSALGLLLVLLKELVS